MFNRKKPNYISAVITVTVVATLAVVTAAASLAYIIFSKYRKVKSASISIDCANDPDDDIFCCEDCSDDEPILIIDAEDVE